MRGTRLVVALGLWPVLVGVAGVIVCRRVYDFDAARFVLWSELYRAFLSGGSLPLDFVCTVLGFAVTGLVGPAVPLWRLFSARATPARRSAARPLELSPAAPMKPPIREAPPSQADAVAFARAMAVFEVWSEPPPAWMLESLREELAGLSAAGWTKMAEWGEAGPRLRRHAEALGLAPGTGS